MARLGWWGTGHDANSPRTSALGKKQRGGYFRACGILCTWLAGQSGTPGAAGPRGAAGALWVL